MTPYLVLCPYQKGERKTGNKREEKRIRTEAACQSYMTGLASSQKRVLCGDIREKEEQ